MYLQVHSYHTVLAVEEQTETSTGPTFVNSHVDKAHYGILKGQNVCH